MLAGPLSAVENARLEFAIGVLEEMRNLNTAQDHFEKARLADPLALPLVQRAVRQRLAIGDRGAAAKLLRDLAAARPDDLHVQLIYADFLEQQGAGDAMANKLAIDALESVLKKVPGHPQVVQRLYQFYQSTGQQSQAVALLDQLKADDPESAMLYASLARKASDANESAQRENLDEHYQLSFAAHPESAALARAASDHFHNTNRPDKAIEILERHVAAEPSSLDLRTRLGILYFAAKQSEKGEAALKAVLEINPQHALAHQSLAKFYRLNDKPELARFHAGELLKIRGGSVSEFLTLANEWLAAEEPRKARLLLDSAVFNHPESPDLVARLAIATRRDPETRKQATQLFRQAEALMSADAKSDPTFLMESAEALLDDGQSKPAEERLRTAIRSFPAESKKETAAALRRLAALWESENRNTEAALALKQRAEALDR